MLSVDEALAFLLEGARPVAETEQVATLAATGRVLAQAQYSALTVPAVDNTSMDGYAVYAADCASGEARLTVSQRVPAGSVPQPLARGTAARIFTGAPIPPGADAVVMQEQCAEDGDAVIVKHRPQAGEWVRRVGEDIRAGSEILAAGMKLRPQDTGLAASVGIAALPLYRRLKVAVFFTGDELAMPGEPLPPGRIYNSNRYTLNGLLQLSGCEVSDYGIVPDQLEATREVLRQAAAGNDVIVTSGGVSVGEEDHIKPAVEAEGRLSMWKIAVKPGKPLAFGEVDAGGSKKAHFIGLPGNPVSSFVTFLVFVRPFILRCQGVARVEPLSFPLRADFDWPKPDPRREFLRVKLNPGGGLDLYPSQSSAVLSSAVWGDGFVDNPARQVIRRGDRVKFLPYSELFQ
ncbi:MAG: molybdopterin molybdotransferase MoeA [Betaproteobacteria bacterium]|nr:molybdopterin molybdotransferase MoeA [Betaproteobacteria bacterium]